MADDALHTLLAANPLGVLTTLRRDGRPQQSLVNHLYVAAAAELRISVTEPRAKTRNLRRDPRSSYFVAARDGSGYVAVDGTATLTPVARDPHDATVEALVGLYRDLRGEHPDWAEYRAVMVADQRVLLTIAVERVYGWLGG